MNDALTNLCRRLPDIESPFGLHGRLFGQALTPNMTEATALGALGLANRRDAQMLWAEITATVAADTLPEDYTPFDMEALLFQQWAVYTEEWADHVIEGVCMMPNIGDIVVLEDAFQKGIQALQEAGRELHRWAAAEDSAQSFDELSAQGLDTEHLKTRIYEVYRTAHAMRRVFELPKSLAQPTPR